MSRRAIEVLVVLAWSTLLTLVLAAPVLQAPSERIFGAAIVGRHFDPFTVMERFARGLSLDSRSQPVTDVAGAVVSRWTGPVAAYNALVLVTFPLSALTTYLLARALTLSPLGATLAALAYAFSPFHLSQGAYHVHIAQLQWLPLYWLALWAVVTQRTRSSVAWLGAAAVTAGLANFYDGMIIMVITPVAAAAWLTWRNRDTWPSKTSLGLAIGSVIIVAGGLASSRWLAGSPEGGSEAVAVIRSDLFRYSAQWWSYLVPPVQHPLWGKAAASWWSRAGVTDGLLEQQVSVSWALLGLAAYAVVRRVKQGPTLGSVDSVPIMVTIAGAAVLCSLSPEWTLGGVTLVRPSGWIYEAAPMFRSYARFGAVVSLMVGLLAGLGLDRLRAAGTARSRLAWVALMTLAMVEYTVRPSRLWRDVLPTSAHRWLVQQPDPIRALDCVPLDQESQSMTWLTKGRVVLLGGPIRDCADPHLPEHLAVNGFTHLIVRRPWPALTLAGVKGLQPAASFDDASVFTVTAAVPLLYRSTTDGWHRREHDALWSWQWMGGDASWVVVNRSDRPIVATLRVELAAFLHPRWMVLMVADRPAFELLVGSERQRYQIGPLTLPTGSNELVFHPRDEPTVGTDVPGNHDSRRLSFRFGDWNWQLDHGQP